MKRFTLAVLAALLGLYPVVILAQAGNTHESVDQAIEALNANATYTPVYVANFRPLQKGESFRMFTGVLDAQTVVGRKWIAFRDTVVVTNGRVDRIWRCGNKVFQAVPMEPPAPRATTPDDIPLHIDNRSYTNNTIVIEKEGGSSWVPYAIGGVLVGTAIVYAVTRGEDPPKRPPVVP